MELLVLVLVGLFVTRVGARSADADAPPKPDASAAAAPPPELPKLPTAEDVAELVKKVPEGVAAVTAAAGALEIAVATAGAPAGTVGAAAGTALAGGGGASGVGAATGTALTGGSGGSALAVGETTVAVAAGSGAIIAPLVVPVAAILIGVAAQVVAALIAAQKTWQDQVWWKSTINPRDVTQLEHDLAVAILDDATRSGKAGAGGGTYGGTTLAHGYTEAYVDDDRCSKVLPGQPYVSRGTRAVLSRPTRGLYSDPYRWAELEQVCRVFACELIESRAVAGLAWYKNWLGFDVKGYAQAGYVAVDEVPGFAGNVIDRATRERVRAFARSTSFPTLMARLRWQGLVDTVRIVRHDPNFYPLFDAVDYARDRYNQMGPSDVVVEGPWWHFDAKAWGLEQPYALHLQRLKDAPFEGALGNPPAERWG